jgi:hypothetical protein
MIRHLVGWNLVAEDADAKGVAAEEIRVALEGLVGVVPGLIDLRVFTDDAGIAGNSDLALIAHYASVDDLKAYIAHAAHQEAVVVVRARTKDRWAIDYEL